MTTETMAESAGNSLDIAIVGMAGHFPGASNIGEFWENLKHGVESITFFPEQDVTDSGIDPDMARDPDFVPAAGGLNGEYMFDAEFFEFSPREAEIMDPQQRVFLECAWEAMESAGYNPAQCPGRVGIYAGASINTYLLFNIAPNKPLFESIGHFQAMTANDKDFLATRVAYKLNLKGPAVSVQTACSTSLVALNLACQSLLNYQSDMMLAGGVSITPKGRLYQEGFIFSKDGHCRAFDERAQGTVGGNGVGLVVLKRLEDALADGDHIHAVVKGSAVNNDGALKVGYTAPSITGQVEAILEAQGVAGVDPETITYVEAHGTGTLLGDPIEIAALTQAFRTRTDKKGYCAIGSVKTNIGHLDTAAGISGLIKAVLAVEHGQIPPSLHYHRPNPKLALEESPFFVNATLRDWETSGFPRRAGVSSFGFGGTNAHTILEQAPPREPGAPARDWQLLPLSGRNEEAMTQALQNLAGYLEGRPEADLADVSYTLQLGRKHFRQRAWAVAQSGAEAAPVLRGAEPKRLNRASGPVEGQEVATAFMFSGQGSQYLDMAQELYQKEPTFREHFNACAALMRPHLGHDLPAIIYPEPAQREQAEQLLGQTLITQPALFAVEYALARLWQSWGVNPQCMIGHSVGEYVAATLAGVFSLEDAAKLICTRAQLIQQQPGGAMLSLPLAEQKVLPLLLPELSLAVVNAPALCVVSGPGAAVEALRRSLAGRGIEGRLLQVSHAFHSAMMEPAARQFREAFSGIRMMPPKVPFVSNLSGDWITQEQACSPAYWADHLRHPVRFGTGLQRLMEAKPGILLEVGPGQALATLARQQRELVKECAIATSTRHPQTQGSDVAHLLNAVGTLWARGAEIDWHALHGGQRRCRVPLPTYPFQRKLYWVPPVHQSAGGARPEAISAEPGTGQHASQQTVPTMETKAEEGYQGVIAAIWEKMLGVASVGVDDDFFMLGGHSLLATQLVAEVRRATQSAISVQALFEEPTVAGLARRVRELRTSAAATPPQQVTPIPRDGALPLTFHQEWVWRFEIAMPGTAVFNGFITLALKGTLDPMALRFAISDILRRHEVLRTTYGVTADGQPSAEIHEASEAELPFTDLSGLSEEARGQEVLRLANGLARKSFDIGHDRLMRPMLVRMSEHEHLLLVASHYIAVDGWTIGLVIQELGEHYSAHLGGRPSRLPEPPFQCVDYAHWQRAQVTEQAVATHLPYWREQLLDAPVPQPLPLDRPRPAQPNVRGSVYHFALSPGLTQAVKDFSHSHGSTTFMTLVGMLDVLFYAYSGCEDIVLGTITGDREIGMEPLVGAFVNVLALRTRLDRRQSFLQVLENVRHTATDAYAHQIPFLKLREGLGAERDLERSPLFRVMFILRNVPTTETKADGLDIVLSPLPIDRGISEQDVSLYLQEKGGALGGYFEYNTDLFDRGSIEALARNFQMLLRDIMADPEARLEHLVPTKQG